MVEKTQWAGFKGRLWKEEINVRDFIQNNYTPYDGDESFLAGPTEATNKLWGKLQELQKEERAKGGVLDMETKVVTGLTAYGPGYIDESMKDLEQVVGLQTDKPLKRAFMPYGGIKMAEESCENYGYTPDPELHKIFTEYHKTHNQGVFDAYTPEMRAARRSHIITGLPDTYGRGRIVGDYRRVALYGIDYLIKCKEEDKANCGCGVMTNDVIQLREELSDQINALKGMKAMAAAYGYDISEPATTAKEAVQWLYFGYLAAIKTQNGAAMSVGRVSTFLDIYINKDLEAGKITEAEAQELCASVNIGMTYKGEEASTQEKGKISSQDPVQGTKVAKNSTVNYYLSKGSESVTLTDMFGQNGALAQETLESQGLTVQINKIYPDESQSSMVDIGCVLDTEPAAGTTVKAGDTVTLTISRGINYGDSVQVPDVTGMEKNDAIAKLGKFININVEMQMSTDVAEGTVISQDPIGYTDDNPVYADPDNDTITLIVSSGSQDTSSQNTEDQSSSDTTAAVANGEVWKCTQKLKTPIGYNGGLIRLELVQNVGGAPKASSVVEGQQLTFPYQLDITGAPGVAEGTLYLSEQQSDGSYQELGHYPLTFEKVE